MQMPTRSNAFAMPLNVRVVGVLFVIGCLSLILIIGWLIFYTRGPDQAEPVRDATSESRAQKLSEGLDGKLAALGAKRGATLFLRLFKENGELEVWVKAQERYVLLKTIPLCRTSSILGAKRRQGDGKDPEGFYHVTAGLMRWSLSKHPNSIPVGFPNTYDLGRGYSGDAVFITSDCNSIAGYAVERAELESLILLIQSALKEDESVFPIHIFPFRMGKKPLAAFKKHEDHLFWLNLKEVHTYFDKEHLLPNISFCGQRYWIAMPNSKAAARYKSDSDCLPVLPASEVPFHLARRHSWLRQALVEQKLAYWTSPRAIDAIEIKCNLKRPACRRWYNLRKKMILNGIVPRELTQGAE